MTAVGPPAAWDGLLDAGTQSLIEELSEEEFRRIGVRPDPASVVRKALEALKASRLTDSQRAELTSALLQFGQTINLGDALSNDPEANRLVLDDGFAFLLAVIFDQQIRYRRAWRAPLELKKRLGYLDPKRILANPGAVARAIKGPPALHRFPNRMAGFVVAAAQRVLSEYRGSAEVIWADSPTAKDLQRRFGEFAGIAQKKAAMSVEILEKVRGVSVAELHGSDVAYDRHVRRVFLRTGLATYDSMEEMVAVAREMNADRPGLIDFPAFRVGEGWCHASVPDCGTCPLREPCPKLIDRAISVREE